MLKYVAVFMLVACCQVEVSNGLALNQSPSLEDRVAALENNVNLRVAILEKENSLLSERVAKLEKDLEQLKQSLPRNVEEKLPELEGLNEADQLQIFFEAASTGNNSFVERWIEAGLKVNETDPQDQNKTALHKAAEKGHVEVAELLIAAKADVEALTSNKFTPLHLASYYGRAEIVKLLINATANLEAKNFYGETPLHLASHHGRTEALRLLIEAKANLEAQDINGETPLHLAAMRGLKEIVQLLINSKAKVDALGNGNNTALHMAAYEGRNEVVAILIKAGASKTAKNAGGLTPKDMALNGRHQDLAKIL